MKNTPKQVQYLILVFLAIVVYVCGALTIYNDSFIFPVISGVSLLLSLFIFGGKYRLYAITFCVPISALMSIKNSGFGSFLTWNIIIYLLILLVESILKRKINSAELVFIISYLVLVAYTLIIQICNLSPITKFFSSAVYWALPLSYVFEDENNKKIWPLIVVLSLSHICSNLFGCLFIYILPNQAIPFLTRYVPSYIAQYEKFGSSIFRYPGFSGDPNHLGISVLFVSLIMLSYSLKTSKHIFYSIIASIALQLFGFLGGSKTYILCFVFLIIFISIYLIRQTKQKLFYSFIIICCFFIGSLLILSIDSLSKTVARLIFFDDRQGFLEAITTNRLSIWKNDISYLMGNPLKLLFGNGTWSPTIYGAAAHNFYIQIIWDLGLFGTILFFAFITRFFSNKNNNYFLFGSTLLLFITYSFGLHVLYNESVLSCVGVSFCIYSFKKTTENNFTDDTNVCEISI